ncbi:TRAM1 [Cordylochernes scorpioides]|uniref:TRAM1 n=1 Tax=Cordylochernes scorpioides TaxID=51811 RepID=A0ABY6LHD5_9ARAC|nr:TRAM1 [Cordylochernes scorpioides]
MLENGCRCHVSHLGNEPKFGRIFQGSRGDRREVWWTSPPYAAVMPLYDQLALSPLLHHCNFLLPLKLLDVFFNPLCVQGTSPLASKFIAMHHNVTEALSPQDVVYYSYGPSDLCCVLFYLLITVVMHAIIQEYVLDGFSLIVSWGVQKLNRKLHLSKMKHNKFNESGQLLVFYLISLVWSADIIRREGYLLNISRLWEHYPNHEMTYVPLQVLLHHPALLLAPLLPGAVLPEGEEGGWLTTHSPVLLGLTLLLQEDMKNKIIYASLYLIFFGSAYILSYTHIAICLSFLHYMVESIFHLGRLLYFAEKTKLANYITYNNSVTMCSFSTWDVLFVLVRLGSITLSVLTFWYGLALTAKSSETAGDMAAGDFNTQLIRKLVKPGFVRRRLNCLVAVGLLQAWMMWNFINFHLQRMREKAALAARKTVARRDKRQRKEEAKKTGMEDDELPEVDQNTLRSRAAAAAAAAGKSKRS